LSVDLNSIFNTVPNAGPGTPASAPTATTSAPSGTVSTQPVAQATPGASSSSSSSSTESPSYLTTLFPNGIPQATAATVSDVPTVSQVNPNVVTAQIMNALLPQFQQQNQGLEASLADAGIVGGSTTGAVANLGAQQQQQAMGDIAPYIMQALGLNQTAQESNQNAALQGGEYNAGAENAANEMNVSDLLNSAMYDAGTYNTFLGNDESMSNQDWLAELGAEAGLGEAGAGATASAGQGVYYNPTPVSFANLGASFAPPATQPTVAPAPTNVIGAIQDSTS
jgi:hypothetical protein